MRLESTGAAVGPNRGAPRRGKCAICGPAVTHLACVAAFGAGRLASTIVQKLTLMRLPLWTAGRLARTKAQKQTQLLWRTED
jgi:hypothetical protein